MKNFDFRKTLNLHKYSLELQRMVSEWKILLPIIMSISGIIIGTFMIKGESGLYSKVAYLVDTYMLNSSNETVYVNFVIYLLLPTCFAVILFFLGLSVYGVVMVNLIPFLFSTVSGLITYYMYSEYTLKGLAYCVIMLFPYLTLSLFSLILITAECISMSQYLHYTLSSRRRKTPDYSINKFYINSFRSYVFIIVASLIKTGLERLFVGLFRF